ncbi:hypothetical protein L208DRAFT_1376132 [Tricholoma matsutake]|nr:hypothetical protein L208DRAFT_1376132 [Tricholoma matsutake 945]
MQPKLGQAPNPHLIQRFNSRLAKTTLKGAYELLQVLNESSGVFTPLKSVIGGVIACVELYKKTSGNHEEMEQVLKSIDQLALMLAAKLKESKDHKPLDQIIIKLTKHASTPPDILKFYVELTLLVERSTRNILKHVVFQTLPHSHEAAFSAAINLSNVSRVPIVIVDALDESDHGTIFLQELLRVVASDKLAGIKFLVTSRPDPGLVNMCKLFPENVVCKLHEVDPSNVQKDIEKYLCEALPDLKDKPELEELAGQAGGFFIYATTAVRFLSPDLPFSVPKRLNQLQCMLSSWPTLARRGEQLAVDELYEQILGVAFGDDRVHGKWLQILHTVLCAESRINMSVLADLSDTHQDTVKTVVDSLHAVLFVSSKDDCVYWYHTSFSDFIFTQA